MLKEFKEFAMKGNVIDMAVGIIIGIAFGKVVSSLVNDILMPPIGKLIGNVDFSNFFVALSMQHFNSIADAKKAGVAVISYGVFINTIIEFLIVSFAVFLLVQQVRRFYKPAPAPALPATKDCPFCTSKIPVAAKRCPQCTADLPA